MIDVEDPLLGTTIAGRYRVIGKIGQGGMATVYRAFQLATEREVALKVLSNVKEEETRERFLQEARATAQLKATETVIVFDAGVFDHDRLFIAMELLEGQSLDERILERGKL